MAQAAAAPAMGGSGGDGSRKPKSHCELNFAIIAKFLLEPTSTAKNKIKF